MEAEPERLGEVLDKLRPTLASRVNPPPTGRSVTGTSLPTREWPANVRPGTWGEVPAQKRKQFAEAAASQRWPILVLGDVGVGKSTLAALAYRDWGGTTAKFMSAALAATLLKQASMGGVVLPGAMYEVGDASVMKSWCENTGLLVLDDLTNGHAFENSKQMLWRIIDGRAGRPAIYTANGTPDELAAFFGMSLKDRLFQGTTILWGGASRRKGKLVV